MTPTTDTTGHPDVAEISDLTEGLLAPSRSADVRRHLESCDLCADVHASLEEIRGLLGTLPGPPRMPDDVAQRIDAALAAEALLSTMADSDATHVSRETSTAADRPSGHARPATTGPGRKGDENGKSGPSGKGRMRGRRRRGVVLGALFGVAALGLGGVLVFSSTGDDPDTSARTQSTAADTFAKGTLENKVTDLLAGTQNAGTLKSNGVDGSSGTPQPHILEMPSVPDCVQKGIGRSDTALATEEGTYQGKDALLVVLPDTSNSTKVDAYLMDRTCATQSSSGPAKIFLQDSYTRH
ncbi:MULTISPECIES: anti-sigma factor family protein [Streptomyces]|uniref:Anti-sigma factor family protein n=2 Tax=Streptomyces TaxID=1883 RepID=A0ABV9IQH4_9ACTN